VVSMSGNVEDDVFSLLHPRLQQVIKKLGYIRPTRIQRISIPVLLRIERHALIIAPTGSGKTEAALFPILSRILENVGEDPRILYITPLRALNRDLMTRLEKLFSEIGLGVGVWHGDTPRSARKRMSWKPPTMVITTPESLQYLIINKDLVPKFSNIDYVIVDEIHELISSERGSELVAALERLKRYAGPFIRIGISGSIGNPFETAQFLAGPSVNVEIIVDRSGKPCITSVYSPIPVNVSARDEDLDPFFSARVSKIEEILSRSRGSAIVFTNTRDQAERLGAELRRRGLSVGVHHGSLSRDAREAVESDLREGRISAVVATSSLELGIDVGSVEIVIQYMSPRQAMKMLQRIGRSGHREEALSTGYIIASENIYDIAESAVIARRACSSNPYKEIERISPRELPLDVLAHQIAGLVLEEDSISIDEVIRILSKAYPFRNLTQQIVEKVAEFLSSIGILRISDESGYKKLSRGRRAKQYYYRATMIIDTKSYRVVNVISNRSIGELDERFVAKEVSPGVVIVLGGSLWRVVESEGDTIYVEPVEDAEGSIPRWIGQQIPVDRRVAREVCMMLRESLNRSTAVLERYPVDRSAMERVINIVREHVYNGYPVPGEDLVLIESWRDAGIRVSIIHACIGSRASEALGLYILSFLGPSVSYKATPYGIIVAQQFGLTSKDLERILTSWRDPEEIYSRVLGAARSSGSYRWHLVAVAKKMGAVDRDYPFEEALKHAKHFEESVVGEEALKDMLYEELDLEGLRDLLIRIREGRARIIALDLRGPTPLGAEIYRCISGFERVRSQSIPRNLVAELVRRRLEEKEAELICIMCGYSYIARVKDLPPKISCPSCGSVFVGVNKYGFQLSRDLIRRIVKNPEILRDPKALGDEEKDAITMLVRTANLVASYGKKAIVVLMGRGVGPESAADIIASSRDDEDLYVRVLEREKIYMSTKKYWD
jgi:ATP-dependent Lhr-like helicase